MRNWELLIYEMIDKMTDNDKNVVSVITNEIMNAYRFEFIDGLTKNYMIDLVETKARDIAKSNSIRHKQRIYELQVQQEKYKEQEIVKALLIQADNDWKRKNVRHGRPRTVTANLSLSYKNMCDKT